MDEIDWSKVDLKANVSQDELDRLDSLSGKKCSCGKETTVGEDEAWGVCLGCYDAECFFFETGK